MAPNPSAFQRDANYVPITQIGLQTTKSITLSANNTTAAVPLFNVTGTVMVNALYGVITTALGTNVTTAYWRLNDQTAQVDISAAAGVTMSAVAVGSTIYRRSTAAAAAVVDNASAGRVRDPTGSSLMSFTPFTLVQKTGGITTSVEFVYSTTDTPTSGVIQFFLSWIPLSTDGNVTPV